jgi:phospholipid/cholesterol/gamma-HCH transport system substrate-binding protein
MSIRANPTLIGSFVLGAIVLLVAALLLWGGGSLFQTKLDYVLFFDSAVTGLQKGAPVMFRGVRVGQVSEIQIRWGTPLVAVYISLQPDLLKGTSKMGAAEQIQEAVKERGMRAQLRMQSFVTGVLYVALDEAPNTPIVLRGRDGRTPELPTIPTDVEMWMAKLQQFTDVVLKLPLEEIGRAAADTLDETRRLLKSPQTARTLRNTDALVADVRGLVHKLDTLTVKNADVLLADARGLVQKLDALASDLSAQVSPLSLEAKATLTAAQAALADVPRLVADADRLIAKVDARAEPLLASVQRSSDAAHATLEEARSALASVQGGLDQDLPLGYELGQLLRELRDTAQSLRSLADSLERMPDAPVYGVRRPRARDR